MDNRKSKQFLYDYILVRSKRGTCSITIDPVKGIIVRAPLKTPVKSIENMLIKKSEWIMKKIEEVGGLQKRDQIGFQGGDILLLFGNLIRLKLVEGKNSRTKITIEDENIIAKGLYLKDSSSLKLSIIRYYKKIALEYFSENTKKIFSMHSEIFKDKTNPIVKIRYYKRRWGSTSSSGTITFNWRLIMAPKSAIEYVIIHDVKST